MDRTEKHSPSLTIYLSLNAAALLAAGALLTLLARTGANSNLRLLLIGGTFLLAASTAAAAIFLHLQHRREQALSDAIFRSRHTTALKYALGALFLVLWYLAWFPPQYTGDAYYYFIGLYPLILCGVLASGAGLLFIAGAGDGLSGTYWRSYVRQHRASFLVALIALAVFALVALLTAKLQILAVHEPYWYGAGVPLLASQVFAAVIIAVVALNLEARSSRLRLPTEWILFLIVWAVAAYFWASRPVPESYWVTGPRPPNWEFYPFSDLITFDLGSQFALIGQGIFNGMFFDRALYTSFLVYLHALAGQNYQRLMALQAAIFAVFPALLYVLGKKLHSRIAGLVMAALIIMRGVNSLSASAWIDTATFKHMLTDFPTAIGLAIFVLLLLSWLESPQERAWHGLWAAGVLGLTSLLRPHVLLLVPAVMLLAIWVLRSRWKSGLLTAGLMLLAFLAGIAPWMVFGPSSGSIINFYGERVRLILAQRYPGLSIWPAESPTPPPKATQLPKQPPSATQPSKQPPDVTQSATESIPSSATPTPPSAKKPSANRGIPFIESQFLHNLVTAALIFPNSPEFLWVKETVKGDEGFWRPQWDGSMSWIAAGLLILNLLLVALGIGVASRRLGWLGLLPVAVLLMYFTANALARTSGGRYLVPVDWVLVCYFALGLIEVLRFGAGLWRSNGVASVRSVPAVGAPGQLLSWPRALAALAELALIGGLVPMAGILFPRRYPAMSTQALLSQVQPYVHGLGSTPSDLNAFLEQPGAVILYGRALYPRFYQRGVGEPIAYRPFTARSYPRTVFILIGPHGYVHAVLPMGSPKPLPDASDAIVLGCRSVEQGFDIVNALVVVLPARSVSLVRSPSAPLTCPVPEPVCDNNGNCF